VTVLYADQPTVIKVRKVRHHHPDVEAILALAVEQRAPLKSIIKVCREIKRNRHVDKRDKHCVERLEQMHRAMLSISRVGCRS
jgi:hypothetical protein